MAENAQKEKADTKAGDDKKSAGAQAAESKKSEDQSNSGIVRFGKDLAIYTDKELPEHSVGKVKAYQVAGDDGKIGNYMAFVSARHLVPRLKNIEAYVKMTGMALLPLMDYGPVYWTPAKQERYVFIYRRSMGRPILERGATPALGLHPEDVETAVVQSIFPALLEMRDKDFFHGAINPYNIFNANNSEQLESIVLGDCLASPPSYHQSIVYEPIERAMADPISRGPGTSADDLYALGASLAVMLRTSDPLEGLSDDDIIKEKLLHGSYAALAGKERFKGSLLELMRGLLHDDPGERWTVEDIMAWMDGRRLSPKQAMRFKKAARPLTLGGHKYYYPALLAMDIDVDPAETMRIVDGGDLAFWLTRSIEDSDMAERVEEAQKASKESGSGAGYADLLVSNLSSALDSMGPIRYKGLRINGDGLGRALVECVVLKQDIKPFVEIFTRNVGMNWATCLANPNLDSASLVSMFEKCKSYIKQSKLGFGIERCIYSLCPESHCLSEILEDYFVTNPETMMNAFEDLCKKGKAPKYFLDRHSITFLSVQDPKIIDTFIFDLDSVEEHKRILANLKCLAAIQKRWGLGQFPAIGGVFLNKLSVVYKRFHDQSVRKKIQKEIERHAKLGDLSKMVALLDNPDMAKKDLTAFKAAMAEYRALREEGEQLKKRLEIKDGFGEDSSRNIAAIVSTVLAIGVIIIIAFFFVSSGTSGRF